MIVFNGIAITELDLLISIGLIAIAFLVVKVILIAFGRRENKQSQEAPLLQAETADTSMQNKLTEIWVPVSVAYGSDLEKVEEVSLEVAKRILSKMKKESKGFEPKVLYNKFGRSGIEFNVVLQIEESADKFEIIHRLIKALAKRYAREKIEFSAQKMDIYIKGFEK
jgi:hypothetical protein